MPLLQLILNLPALMIGTLIKGIWFQKKGFGKVYRQGLMEGFKTLHKINKVPFKWKYLKNYIYIEWLLIKSTVTYVVSKIGK